MAALLLIGAGRAEESKSLGQPVLFKPVLELTEEPAIEIADPDFRLIPRPVIVRYREVPPENMNPISFVNPPGLLEYQMHQIIRWEGLVQTAIDDEGYPQEYYMIALGMIAQESGGDPNLVSTDGHGSVGLMQIIPRSWTGTEHALKNPRLNIYVGLWMLDAAYRRAVEDFNFEPGRDAMRAALAAFNCGFASLLEDRCLSFGGWTYADKINFYWIPLIEEDYEKHNH